LISEKDDSELLGIAIAVGWSDTHRKIVIDSTYRILIFEIDFLLFKSVCTNKNL
jgi:hypothetical protein